MPENEWLERLPGIAVPYPLKLRSRTERDLVRVATFNINNINKRLDNLLAWLAKAEPDVVSLQELKAEQRETWDIHVYPQAGGPSSPSVWVGLSWSRLLLQVCVVLRIQCFEPLFVHCLQNFKKGSG